MVKKGDWKDLPANLCPFAKVQNILNTESIVEKLIVEYCGVKYTTFNESRMWGGIWRTPVC